MKAPLPENETLRLADLARYSVLDTPPEKQLDDLTLIASQICQTPIALISLLDSDRQWFKSRHGFDTLETSRDLAFCGYTILGDDLLIIEDATVDERFAQNALVTGPPCIRFYAGAPLCAPSGSRIGTLCVLDRQPRKLSVEQASALKALARQVMAQLELRSSYAAMAERTLAIENAARQLAGNAELLKRSEAKFRAMADHAPLGIFLTDPAGDALYCNPAWHAIAGLTAEKALGKGWASAIHPEDRERVFTEWYQAATEAREFRSEYRFMRPDGSVVWTSTLAAAFSDNGVLLGHVGTVEDVSERRIAGEALRESEARYRSVISALSEGVVLQSREGAIQTWNESACRILGLSADQLAGRKSIDPRWQAIHLDGSPFAGKDHPAMVTLRTGQPVDEQVMGLTLPSGEQRWVSINTRALFRNAESTPYSVVASFHDITVRLQATLALEKAKLAAETANRAKSAFLANMSHEIRTPMTAILGYADLLDDAGITPREHAEYVDVIRRNGAHLTRVIDDVLDVSKIEAGGMKTERISFSPRRLVEEVASLMRVRATEKGIDFNVQYVSHLPPLIESDPMRLRQILFNLVGNAIKFTERGAVGISVEMVGQGAETRLTFNITDTGIGLTPIQQAGLFRSFAQADTSMSRRFGGTGLGLAISKSLTEMLGGLLEVRSEWGKGSTFTATIAIGDIARLDPAPKLPDFDTSKALPEPANALRCGSRILLAEDSADNRRLVLAYLGRAGLETETAVNGKLAVEMVTRAAEEARPYDLVLMDMQMPEMDGYEATRTLRRLGHRSLPIIAFTAHALDEERAACMQAGCDDYASKPIEPETLLATVRKHLGRGNVANGKPITRHGSDAVIRSTRANDPVLQAILPEYVAELPRQVSALNNLIRRGELLQLKSLIHQIKGAAGSYGFQRITELAGQAEATLSLDKDLNDIAGEVARLVNIIRQVDGYDSRREQHAASESTQP